MECHNLACDSKAQFSLQTPHTGIDQMFNGVGKHHSDWDLEQGSPLLGSQVRKMPGNHNTRASDLLDLVQLQGLGDRFPRQLSGGSGREWHWHVPSRQIQSGSSQALKLFTLDLMGRCCGRGHSRWGCIVFDVGRLVAAHTCVRPDNLEQAHTFL